MALISCILDGREPLAIQGLPFGVPTSVAILDAGDCLGMCSDGTMILVERKTVRDLLSSIADGRLLSQAARMRAATPWCYLVVTGELVADRNGCLLIAGSPSQWQWTAIQGALLSVQELGVCVVQATSDNEYAATVQRLAARSHDVVRVAARRNAEIVPESEAILMALPMIGDTHAKTLLATCGTPAWALTYLTGGSGFVVPGVGTVARQRARRALGLRENECLHVLCIDDEQPSASVVTEADPPTQTALVIEEEVKQ